MTVRSGYRGPRRARVDLASRPTLRPSFALYNAHEEIERLARAVRNLSTG